jgi:putative transposase
MTQGRRASRIELSAEDRAYLEQQVRRRKVSRALSERAQIVLLSASGLENKRIARKMGVGAHMVGKWRKRFAAQGVEGLLDEPRLGRPLTVEDARVQEVVTRTLESLPSGATHWSTRGMAEACGLSHMTVARIWKAFGLQPHRVETFKLSTDPQFVEKVQDIVGLYLSPPDKAIVLCVDEKSQIQALDRTQPVPALAPGAPERRTHDYVRNGTLSLFAALDTATGFVTGKCFGRHRSRGFLAFLEEIDKNVPEGLAVHLIMDNYATHKTEAVRKWLARRPHYHVHFTPASASWINQIERWFGLLTEKQIKRGVHNSVRDLERDIKSFIALHNKNPKPFRWVKSADDILASVRRFCTKQAK